MKSEETANINDIHFYQTPGPRWNVVLKSWDQKIMDSFCNNNPDQVSKNASLSHQSIGLGSKLHSFGRNIEGLEARLDSQAVDKSAIELARNNYQLQTTKIEHFLKENARLKQQVQASLSPAFSPSQPATKRSLGGSK